MSTINFEYPTFQELEGAKKIASLNDVKKFFNTILSPIGEKISLQIYYRRNKTHIVAYCRGCQAKLIWKKNEENYEIERVQNSHNHPTQASLRKFNKFSLISKFLETLPPEMQKKAIMNLASVQLNVSKNAVNYVLKRQQKAAQRNLQEIFQKQANNWTFFTDHQFTNSSVSLPKLLILTNNKMKELYKKYGRTMSLDLTFSTVVQKSEKSESQYLVGIFSGVNSFYKTVIFSMAIMGGTTKADYKQLLYTFFKLQNNKFPETICSDQQPAFIEAVEQLKNQGFMETDHTLDIWHLLRSAKQNRRHLQKMSQLLNSRTYFEYNSKYNDLISQMSPKQIGQFQQKIHENRGKSCLVFVQKFVGLNVSDSRNDNFHNRLKTDLPIRKPYHLLVEALMNFSDKINGMADVSRIENKKLQDFLFMPILLTLRIRVSKQVYQFFMREWGQSQLYSSQKIQTGCHRVFNFEGAQYLVKFKEDRWRCECKLFAKTGVSCSHEIKVLTIQGINLMNSIDPVWIFEQKVTRQIIQQMNRKEKEEEKLRSKNKFF